MISGITATDWFSGHVDEAGRPTRGTRRQWRASSMIEEFRRTGGTGRTLLLTTTGARSGEESHRDRRGRDRHVSGRATPLEGEERDRLFAKQKEAIPAFADYESPHEARHPGDCTGAHRLGTGISIATP